MTANKNISVAEPQFVLKRLILTSCIEPAPTVRTVRRVVDMSRLDDAAIATIDALLRAAGLQLQAFYRMLEMRQFRRFVIENHYRDLRDQMVAEGYTSPYGLQARHWKVTLQAAKGVVQRYWRAGQAKALKDIRKRRWFSKLSPVEKQYVNAALKDISDGFFDIMDGKNPALIRDADKIPSRIRLCNKIRRKVREHLGKPPSHGADRSLWFDCECWSLDKDTGHGRQQLRITTMVANKRLTLTLRGMSAIQTPSKPKKKQIPEADAGKKWTSKSFQLVKSYDRYYAHYQIELKPDRSMLPVAPENYASAIGMDIGYTELFTLSDGTRYGEGFGKRLTEISEQQNKQNKGRNRFHALLKTTADPKKRRHILKYNLGTKKLDDVRHRQKETLTCFINHSINEILKTHPAEYYVVEDLGASRFPFKWGKAANRRLSFWSRGTVFERLIFKAACKGIKVAKVPAAYTSQTCPHCGYTDAGNRHGDSFECKACHCKLPSDQVGAMNILSRLTDETIGQWKPKEEIRKILRERYEEHCKEQKITPLSGPGKIRSASAKCGI